MRLIDDLESSSQPVGESDLRIYDVLRYHLGFVDQRFQPARVDSGKRIRPKLCLSCCTAASGDPVQAIPVAAAIELLHNFTLIHDDIQDRSHLRRHRPTVWALWGTPQAINAGDTLFAISHIALNSALARGVSPSVVLDLSNAMHETTLRIVEGQVLDLGFENRSDVHADEYLTMIRGKTAAILGYACAAGATLAGLERRHIDGYAAFGEALGVGFQILDDELGIWGRTETTGKPEADDIRRRKKGLPFLILRETATQSDRDSIDSMFAATELDENQTNIMLDLMTKYEIQGEVQRIGTEWHTLALDRLENLSISGAGESELRELVSMLSSREN